MVIDKGKLIALLVEKTGLKKDEAEKQLDGLIKSIQLVAETEESFTIEGLGTFTGEKGELHFDVAPRLEIEINQKYAGMKPIELMAAFKKSGAGVPVEETKAAEPDPPPEKTEKPKTEEPPEEEISEEEPAKEPPAAVTAEPGAEKVTAKEEKEKTAAEAAKTPKGQKRKGKKSQEEEKDPLGTILVAAVCVIVILVGGWLLYANGVFGFNAPKPDRAQNNPAQPMAMQHSSTNNKQAEGRSSPADSITGTETTEQDSVTAASLYGLRGDVNPKAKDGYTIVIHSFSQEATVREIKEGLAKKGYRVVLLQEGTRWRVGLGQFKTEEKAQKTAQDLPEPYKSNHFIKRM